MEDCEQVYKIKSDLENKIVDYESNLLLAEQKVLELEKANAKAATENSEIVKKKDALDKELKEQINENKNMEKSKQTLENKVRTLHTEVLETKANAKSDLIVKSKTLISNIGRMNWARKKG